MPAPSKKLLILKSVFQFLIFSILVFSPWLSSDADEALYGEQGIWMKGSTDVAGDVSVGGDIIIGRDSNDCDDLIDDDDDDSVEKLNLQ